MISEPLSFQCVRRELGLNEQYQKYGVDWHRSDQSFTHFDKVFNIDALRTACEWVHLSAEPTQALQETWPVAAANRAYQRLLWHVFVELYIDDRHHHQQQPTDWPIPPCIAMPMQ